MLESILVTGGRSGIAKEVINKLKDKYRIYVTVHTLKELEIVNEMYGTYQNIVCFKLDVTNKKDKEKLKKLDIDILLSFAAIGIGGSIIELPISKLRENFEVNVFSNFEIIQIVINNMLKKDRGKVIIMSSIASKIPLSFLGSYCSTKASISMISHTLKKEIKYLSKNIKIKLIEPGMYKTGFNDVMLDNKYRENSIFKKYYSKINFKEKILFGLLEKRSLNSIVNKICLAIDNKHKFIYRAPFTQALAAKIYALFKM